MMVRIGNFFFHYRNGLFPLLYLLLFLNGPAAFPDQRLALLIGVLVAMAGQILRGVTVGLDYIVRGGRNRQVYAERLVQGGLFAHCRNPLYVGNYMILVGVGIAANSLLFLAIGLPFFLFAYWAIIAAEEAFLRGKFGEEFVTYCAQVNRLLPSLSGLSQTLDGMRFNWRRLLSAEYGSAYIWMAAIILASLKNLWFGGQRDIHNPYVWMLWLSLVLVSVAYLVARFLKKCGRLDD
ncbi:MAG: isoprenylcysteine carboxylmethyltransferase family protein [Verrucomicrobia bacterium]|nr:isoprenylcysteine carboxylmethyltransferase family protein [Verrucomicrobiota bacterium]